MNWKAKPLTSYQTIINLINATKTKTGLSIRAKLDKRTYQKGKKLTQEEIGSLNIRKHTINPQWNYTIIPQIA
jgi:hypothetical protein